MVVSALATVAAGVSVAVAPAASANGPCTYVSNNENVYVRENPSINSVVRKTVPPHYQMSGPTPCGGRTGSDGRTWFAVDCGCATDGVGWVIADKVTYVPL
jgi:hypothetical protein